MSPQSRWTGGKPQLHFLDWDGSEAGDPALLLHGLAGNCHWWDSAVPELQKAKGSNPIGPIAALDLRGHGDSGWTEDWLYDMDGFIADIEAARRTLGWERMILIGHSLGGRIALDYAARHPQRLSSLIAVDFIPELPSHPSKKSKFERARHRRQPSYPNKEDILRRFRLEPQGTLLDETALRHLARECIRKTEEGFTWKFDWRALAFRYEPVWPILSKIQTPTLLVRGEFSEVMNRESCERMLGEIKGSRSIEIARAHHHVPLDTPKELAQEIWKFSESLKANKSA